MTSGGNRVGWMEVGQRLNPSPARMHLSHLRHLKNNPNFSRFVGMLGPPTTTPSSLTLNDLFWHNVWSNILSEGTHGLLKQRCLGRDGFHECVCVSVLTEPRKTFQADLLSKKFQR